MAVDAVINRKPVRLESSGETPLLWVLRDELNLVGTKFACGAGLCGACTVLIDGRATRSCQVALTDIEGKSVVTIDGVDGAVARDVIDAWIAAQAPQCGYCQPGFVMATIGAITADPGADAAGILKSLTNICRCGTYDAIRVAVTLAVDKRARSIKLTEGSSR
jgi:isoquinoline 1-oxidoreductase alpha subunit